MAKIRIREEVANTYLAQIITELGVVAEAETILSRGMHRPDVLFQLRGLRIVIESKFDDVAGAQERVHQDAAERVEESIAHIAVAVVYPKVIRTTPTSEVYTTLKTTKLKYRIVSESSNGTSWTEGTPEDMMESVRRVQETLARGDIVEKTAIRLSAHLEKVATLWQGEIGTCERMFQLLGMDIANTNKTLSAEQRESVAKIASLVLANAYIFQGQLARVDGRVKTLATIKSEGDILRNTSEQWHEICEKINYYAIFQLGEQILHELPSQKGIEKIVASLIDEANAICNEQSALRHDLMGRIYHWLLQDAKYLGTYYTSVSAATMLLKVALSLDWKTNFGDIREISNFKVADMASGTGTLLMAATQVLTDNYVKSTIRKNIESKSKKKIISKSQLNKLHQTLMEDTIYGFDILPTAVHLTASTLALLAPEIEFQRMNLFVMPVGIDHGTVRLGSLDFLFQNEINTQFSLDQTHLETVRRGVDQSSETLATVPPLDLCVMNPPFTSSRGSNKLFGSHGEDRPRMQKELKQRAKRAGVSCYSRFRFSICTFS